MGCCFSSAPEQPAAPAAPKPEVTREITAAEVKQHATPGHDQWIVVKGKVYAVGDFINSHPGGAQAIQRNAGKDCTEGFTALHDESAWSQLETFCIGKLVGSLSDAGPSAAEKVVMSETKNGSPVALKGPETKVECKLVERKEISPDTRRFRFSLPTSDHVLGLPLGQHVRIEAKINGEHVMRSYTPTSAEMVKGHFDLVVKVYFSNKHPDFPDGGKMSQYIDKLKIGDPINVMGPRGHFEYLGNGAYMISGKKAEAKSFGFICGGSGITPAYQVILAMLSDPTDNSKAWLLFANQTEKDILLREELDEFSRKHSTRFQVYYTVSKETPEGWQYGTGRVSEEMIKQHIPSSGPDTLVCMCGPPPMIDQTCRPILEQLGHSTDRQFVF